MNGMKKKYLGGFHIQMVVSWMADDLALGEMLYKVFGWIIMRYSFVMRYGFVNH